MPTPETQPTPRPAGGEGRAVTIGFQHCDACGCNTHWVNEMPSGCRECGAPFSRAAAPRPAPATPRDVLEPLLETLRVEARDDETFNGGRESPQTRAAKDAILTAVDAMIGGANA